MNIPYIDIQALQSRFSQQDHDSLSRVLEQGQFIGGDMVDRFEKEYAAYCGVDHCVGTGNGLDALSLLLKADQQLGHLPQQAKILVPAHTFIATFLSIIHAGMQPIPVDTSDLVMQYDDVAQKIDQVDAIVVVDLYGKLVDESVYALAAAKNKPIYCDAAQSHGAVYANNKRSGSMARASAFSFYPTKNLGALGDGGAVTTNDTALASRIRSLANYGKTAAYKHDFLGYNSRLDPLQASFLSTRLQYLDQDNSARKEMALSYVNGIQSDQVCMMPCDFFDHNAIHVFPVFCDDKKGLVAHLSKWGIGVNYHYPVPPYQQTALSMYKDVSCPNTQRWHDTQISLPCHPLLTHDQIDHVINAINSY